MMMSCCKVLTSSTIFHGILICMIFRPERYAKKHLYVQYCIRMEITVLYFWHYSLCIIQFCFATIAANRFPSLSNEELQGKHFLKIVTALKHTKSNKQAHIHTKTFNLLKKNIHIGTSIQSLLALNAKDQWFSPSPIKILGSFSINLQH